MTDFKIFKLGELGEFQNGYAFQSKNLKPTSEPGTIEVFKMGHINPGGGLRTTPKSDFHEFSDKLSRYLLQEDDIVIAMTDMKNSMAILGHPAIIQKRMHNQFLLNQRVGRFRCNKDLVDPRYLYYYLKNPSAIVELQKSANSGVQVNLTTESIKGQSVALPPRATQTSIAEILSSLDDKIELNNQINNELEALAQAIFKHWFIDFEFPISAAEAVAMGKPELEGKPYKSSGGEMVESELGEIPKGWKNWEIGELIDIVSGFAFKSSDFEKSGRYRLVTIRNVQDGKFISSTENGIDRLPNNLPEEVKLNIGDVLISLTGNVGRTCFVTTENNVLNQRVAKALLKGFKCNSIPYFLFRRDEMQRILISIAKGTAQLNLSPVELKKLSMSFPSTIPHEWIEIMESLYNLEVLNEIENNSLSSLRDTILPRLISGELELSKLPINN